MQNQNREKWLSWTMEIQSLAQAGLAYTTNVYDIERYERLRDISAEMMAEKTGYPLEKVKDLFCSEAGYQTPRIDTRAVVFKLKTEKFFSHTKKTEHGRCRAAGATYCNRSAPTRSRS